MPILSLPYDAALRIIAVQAAASDPDRSSPILSGVCLRSVAINTDVCNGNALVIVSTDGKLLLEEQWSLDAGTMGDAEVNLGPDAVAQLALWLKSVKASLGKRCSCTMEMEYSERSVTFRVPGLAIGECPLRCTEGSFPRYDHALRPSDKPSNPDRIGFNLAYFAAVAKAWKQPKLDSIAVEVIHYRGTVLRLMRLPIGCQSALALVMPISMPR
jgi:hypothetical protein